MRLPLILAVTCALLPTGMAHAEDKEAKKDLEKLQGTWGFESLKEDPKVKRSGREWTEIDVKEKRMAITFGNNKTLEPLFTLDAAQNPRRITFTFDDGKRKDKQWQGIYKVEGDTLTLCFPIEPDANNSPTDFTTPENSGLRLVIMKRKKN